jgi:hypothetical protein
MNLAESLRRITPTRLREGRMPFVFYSGVVLLIVIALIAFLTPTIGSQEGHEEGISVYQSR